MQKITPFLWFDNTAEEAVNYYVALFKDARINSLSRYPEGTPGQAGSVMTVEFTLFGQDFIALNGGPYYQFTPAISFFIKCEDQAEVDRYWDSLSAGGQVQQCGWLTDRFGITWQVVPTILGKLLSDPDPVKANRVTQAMLKMVKLDVAGLLQAYEQV